jgi:predicted amidohydrolase YtcJ
MRQFLKIMDINIVENAVTKELLILYNANIHTQDPAYPQATALAILGGRILAVGSDDEILALAGPRSQMHDLRKRRVLPGLTDAHFHFYDWSLGRNDLALAETRSMAEIRELVAERTSQTPPGEWIKGQGWNETAWPEARLPSRADLDDIAPTHPVIVWRSDLHLALVNSMALKLAGITSQTVEPKDGVIDRDASGEPTGILRELAINLVRAAIPSPTEEQTVQAMRLAFPELHKLGLTGLHDFRIMGGQDGPPAFQAYQNLNARGEIAARLWMHLPYERLDEAAALGLRTGFGDDYLRVGHIKMFSDGAQGARTAWMLEPYLGADHSGMPLTSMGDIAEAVHKADRSGLAVAVHAIGDRANRELITVFEETLRKGGRHSGLFLNAKHRIEHVQNIRPEDVSRLATLDVAASVQPIHATDDIDMIEATVGERGRFAYVFRDLLEAEVTLALGSDCPVASPNPFWGIQAAATRRRRNGYPEDGWYKEQVLTVAEAVWGYTIGPAIITGLTHAQGSLTPGKYADLVVLDRDIFSIDKMEIAETRPVLTVFDGRVVYEQY